MYYFFYSITLLSLFVVSILVVFFLVTEKGVKPANRILSALLFLFALQIFYSFAVSFAYRFFGPYNKSLFLLRQAAFLTGPLIYLYVQAFLKAGKLRATNLFHALPFIGALLFFGLSTLNIDHFVIWKSPLNLYDTILILTHNFIYIMLSICTLRRSNYSIAGIFRNLNNTTRAGWLHFYLLGFVILWVISLNSFAILMITKETKWCAYTFSIYSLTFFLFIIFITFLLLLKPEIFFFIEKYRNSPVDLDIKNNYRQSLAEFMESRKPYLEPEITIEDIAKEISVNTRILSQIINESFRKNFNSFINEYRINESLQHLSNTSNKKTIQEILYESGFNSTSAFYSEFKKHTGLTPQAYRSRYNKTDEVLLADHHNSIVR